MTTLSTYWFEDTDFRGNATYVSVPESSDWARIPRADLSGVSSVLVLDRPDAETRYDLTTLINLLGKPVIDGHLSMINVQLASHGLGVSHRPDWVINAGWRQWRDIGGPTKEPGKTPAPHADDDLLVRVYFDVHINTPWWALAVDGRLEIYIWVYLSRSRVRCRIDAYDVFTWGGSVLDAAVDGALKGALGQFVASADAQQTLEQLQNSLPQDYSRLYLVPGSGELDGSGPVNAEERVTLAIVPAIRTPTDARFPRQISGAVIHGAS